VTRTARPKGEAISRKTTRKYKIGDPVIWTDYHDQKHYPCEILGFV